MKLEPVAWALAYDGKLQTETIYTDHKTALRHAEIENERWEDVDWSVVDFYPPIPPGYKLVPVEPTEAQWSGLARDMMFVLRDQKPTPRRLLETLTKLGNEIPEWLKKELPDPQSDHVMSKGTCCVLIYKAMIEGEQ